MDWYKITPDGASHKGNIFKTLRDKMLMVRKGENDDVLFACVGIQHKDVLLELCKENNSPVEAMTEPPIGFHQPRRERYIMPCGVTVYDPVIAQFHPKSCEDCKAIAPAKFKNPAGKRPAHVIDGELAGGHNGPSQTIAKLVPSVDHDIPGCIASLKDLQSKMHGYTAMMDTLIPDLEALESSWQELLSTRKEFSLRLNAVTLLLKEGKINP